jgi:hypothetical protein
MSMNKLASHAAGAAPFVPAAVYLRPWEAVALLALGCCFLLAFEYQQYVVLSRLLSSAPGGTVFARTASWGRPATLLVLGQGDRPERQELR